MWPSELWAGEVALRLCEPWVREVAGTGARLPRLLIER